MISRSLWRSRASLVSFDHMTPDDTMTRSDEMSHRSGSASSARRIGLANASPTIDIELMRCCCTVSSSSAGSKRRPSMQVIDPPTRSVLIALKNPVPCINGAAGMPFGPAFDTLAANASRSAPAGMRCLLFESSAPNTSSWRHMTPFGIPVVPPVYNRMRWSPERPHGPAVRPGADAAAASYGVAHAGQSPSPSSTHSQARTRGTRSRNCSMVSVKAPWKTTEATSALSHRYTSSSGA
jgi:hypothetical protein